MDIVYTIFHPAFNIDPLKFNLRRAAKARIHRMIQPKSKRRELLAPDYVAKEWQNGDKNGMADLLVSVNWSKDPCSVQIWWF